MGKTPAMSTATLLPNGQLVIPNQLREALHLRPGDKVTLTLEGQKLVVQRDDTSQAALVEENNRKVLVAPPGAPPMTTETVKALHPDIVNITGLVPPNLDAEVEHRRHLLDKHR